MTLSICFSLRLHCKTFHYPQAFLFNLCSVLADAAKGVRTPYLQLSAMQEGDYTFQLTVTDSAHQRSTAEVTLIVQPGKSVQAWLAPAGLAQPAALAPTPPLLAL